jgi:acetylornithine deacetylase
MKTLQHLENLVSFDTQNPPREITRHSKIFEYLVENLTDFDITTTDNGDGCISLLATRGYPKLLFNFHIDTVPVTENWTSDPLKLSVKDHKAFGLGACDIKGAAACMLSVVNKTKGDVALLFTSDEEHGNSTAVKTFLQSNHHFTQVVVAEPTQAQAVLAHRGIQTADVIFAGQSGHASEARAIDDSAIHKAGEWIASSTNWIKNQNVTFETLAGLPFNIGKIDGGIKANMIAPSCQLSFGFRPLPGQNSKTILQTLKLLVNGHDTPDITAGFYGPTLPAANQKFENAIQNASALANYLNIPIGNPVDFWTEASLFSDAGITAIVFGPGDIAQAHTSNEWVSLKQLDIVEKIYHKIIGHNNEH